jgi:SAM-dependent methyltransferase
MFFLTEDEKKFWMKQAEEILVKKSGPATIDGGIRDNLKPAFYFYAGTYLAAKGFGEKGREWIEAGIMDEVDGVFSNAFLSGFFGRQNGKLIMPEVAFEDPLPYVHFTTVPFIKESRKNFIKCCEKSLPEFNHPLKIIDIGCGNGALVVSLLEHLRKEGNINDIGEILLVDASPAMIELAKETVGKSFPQEIIKTINSRIENVAESISGKYDIALSSLAYHHMPIEKKKNTLKKLKDKFDHFIIFEIEANHDTPELHSPELAFSLYQCYGRMIDHVFAHDAPVEIVLKCVDNFLMTEEVSILTQPRGKRTEYHMLQSQWLELFEEVLAPDFSKLCDATCYGDEYTSLYAIHYGRD